MTCKSSICNRIAGTFLFLVCYFFVYGQQKDLKFHHIGIEHGVSELTNEYIFEDLEGFIWIGSISGLNRYDGKSVRKYLWNPEDSTSIHGENIQSPFFELDRNGFWFCTYEAINYYDRKHDHFEDYFLVDSTTRKEIVAYHVFHLDSLAQLWLLADENKIYTFDTKTREFTFISVLPFKAQRAKALTDQQGRIKKIFAFTVNEPGIIQFDLDHEQVIKTRALLQKVDGHIVFAREILIENDSVLWFGGNSEIVRYNFIKERARRIPVPIFLDMETWSDSKLIITKDEDGILLFDKETLTFGPQYKHEVTNRYSVLTNRIRYISKVRNGGYWFCSEGVGISSTYPAKTKFELLNPYQNRDVFFNPIFFTSIDNAIYTCLDREGLIILNDQGAIIEKLNTQDPVVTNRLKNVYNTFFDRHDRMWISSYLGPCVYTPQNKKVTPVGSGKLFSGIELVDGRILFLDRDTGIHQMVESHLNVSFPMVRPEIFVQSYASPFVDHLGRLWLSEDISRCFIIDPVSFDTLASLPIKGFPASYIEVPTSNTMWVISSMGLFNIDTKNLRIRKNYTEHNGFPATNLSGMLMDKKGNLWIATGSDMIVFNPMDSTARIYKGYDGLPVTTFNPGSVCQFADGKMWFGSPDGITSFYPDQITDISTAAIPQITSFQINDHKPASLQCLSTQSTNITEIEKMRFSYKENTLGFIVNALEYSAPSSNKVMYKMENLDPDWVTTTNGALVRYPNMPPGKYIFYVKAFNSDGVANEKLRILEISIIPPYYKTWWFYTLLVLAGLGLLSLFLYLRISKALEIQKVRLRLYENLHDDVGSRLTSIVMSADMMLKEEKSNPTLQQMVSTGRSIISNMKRLVWAIDPVNESMESLILKIRDDRNMTLDPVVHFELASDPAMQQKVIPGEIRYQLMSIISEAFHNITKYAQAKNVWVHFFKKDKHLVMTIRDDGIGFDPARVSNDKVKTSGYGLGNMSKRMKRVNGNLDISSSPGQGTTITVAIPLK